MDNKMISNFLKSLTIIAIASLFLLGCTPSTQPTEPPENTEQPANEPSNVPEVHLNDTETLLAALKTCDPGTRVVLQPGHYQYEESIRIEKDITLLGAGPKNADVLLECFDGVALILDSENIRLENLSLKNLASEEKWPDPFDRLTVRIESGDIQIHNCDVTGDENSACISLVKEDASLHVSESTIHSAGRNGITVINNNKCDISDCDLYGFANGSGVAYFHASHGTVDNCRFFDSYGGVSVINVDSESPLRLTNSEIYDCDTGIGADSSANLYVKKSRIHDCSRYGVICDNDSGLFAKRQQVFDDCDIYSNNRMNVFTRNSSPIFRNIRIYSAKGDEGESEQEVHKKAFGCGVRITEGGAPSFEKCEIFDNVGQNIYIHGNTGSSFKECNIHGGSWSVRIFGAATAGFDSCKLYNNRS